MNKIIWILILILILSGCFLKKKQEEDISNNSLHLFATDVFLNDTFYSEVMPVFENIFNCKVELTNFPNATVLLDELTNNDSIEVDVVFGLDNTLLYKTLRESLFIAYEAPNLRFIPQKYIIDKTSQMIPICFSPIAFIYDNKSIEKAPETFGEMQDGIFKDKIILLNPHTSSLGRAMLIWSVAAFGENGYSHFWRSVKENIFTIADDQEEGYNMFLAAQAPLIQAYSSLTVYHVKQEATDKFKSTIPQEGCFKVIKTAGIATRTKNVELAKHFIDFLLSDDFQTIVPERMWMYPCSKNIKLNSDYQLLPVVENDYTSQLSTRTVGRRISAWLNKWDSIMLK
jgi:thiamine transport system substrate-binding protein